jgi:predicted HicB family RNase H-like nuclease
MKKKHGSRNTVRGVPPAVSSMLRDSARREAKSLNEAAIEALDREHENLWK